MNPLSSRKRLAYLFVLVVLFLIIVPVALLFSTGWRYKPNFGFVKTGGIFVTVPYANAQIFLDGAPVGESGFLNRRLYISDLAPSAYLVHVEQDGYRSWDKVLIVEASLVTDAQALLIPEEILTQRIIVGSVAATGTYAVSSSTRAQIEEIFVEPFASSSAAYIERGSISLSFDDGDVSIIRTDAGSVPSNFCGRPSYCVPEIPVEHTKQVALSAAFFGGGVVYATREGGVFLSEADVRAPVSSAQLFPKVGATFRIFDGTLVVKHGKEYYRIPGL